MIAREYDTLESLKEKIELATFIGTIQSSLTNFKGISSDFIKNSEDERLLGVSISGIMDCPAIASGEPKVLEELKLTVIKENRKWAKKLGINPSTSVTCVKPDGNTSVLYDTAPGVHGRYSPYYIRRMRMQFGKPVANFAVAAGIPAEPAFGETWENIKTVVLSFPVKSPDSAVIQTERSAIEQLENWLKFKRHYTETNPSVTITHRQHELEDIAAWLYAHQEEVVGLSFLPYDDHTYQQAPYEAISKETYEKLVAEFPDVDLKDFWQWEVAIDTTSAVKNLACAGGACLL